MGCYVNISSAETRAKSNPVKIASLLRIVTGILFIGLSFSSIDAFAIFIGVGVIEFAIARWLWSQRIEAWGIAVGFSIFHLIYPLAFSISLVSYISVAVVSIVQLIFLTLVRLEGFYSFVHLARVDPTETLEPTPVQKSVFNLVFVTQLLKALLFFIAISSLYMYESASGPLYWYGVPLFPLVFLFGILNLIAAIGFILGHDWGFHLVLVMAALGLVETVFAAGIPIILISIWIITLLFPCWAKWTLYSKLLHRIKGQVSDTLNHVKAVPSN